MTVMHEKHKDLFAALSMNRYTDLCYSLEGRIADMFDARHEYPMWPVLEGEMDEYEEALHSPFRHSYYQMVKILINVLRELRRTL
jgi:hypothetical protein